MRLRTKIAALAAAGAALVAIPTIATAVIIDFSEPTYSACLKPGGGMYRMKEGADPTQPCEANETEIHLSGGDITSVLAGPGLVGGSESGPAPLGIDTKYRLPQGCGAGKYPSAQAGGTWSCGTDIGRIQASLPALSLTNAAPDDAGCVNYSDFVAGVPDASTDNAASAITLPGGVYRVLPNASFQWLVERTREYGNESTFASGWVKVEVIRRLQGIDMPVATWARSVDEHMDYRSMPMNQDFGTFATAGGAQFFTKISAGVSTCSRARVLGAALDFQRVG